MAEEELTDQKELFEHFRFLVEPGQSLLRLDKYLFSKLENTSRTRIQNAAIAGNILVNNNPVKSSYRVKPDDLIQIVLPAPPREIELIPENISVNIIYEDDDIIGTYSVATEMINPSKIAGTPYTLFDSGDFYKSFVIRVGKRIFEIDADTSDMDGENWWVQNNITKDAILGLTDENKTKLSVEVKRRFIIEARKILLRNT